jgi:hypothetical protein
MIVRDQTIENAKLSLDGGSFYGCVFRGCTLMFSGLLPVVLDNCQFQNNCRWEFNGPAMNTIQFLSAIYQGGARELVEKHLRGYSW